MNVYDEAHSLARAIRESNEFREFDRMRKEVAENVYPNSLLNWVKSFR